MSAVLVTGGSGFVGKAFVARLLEQSPETRIYALLRPRSGSRGWARRLGLSASLASRVTPLFGDLRRDALGLSAEDRGRLQQEDALDVWHIAAATALDRDAATADEVMASNLLGTVQLLRALQSIGDERVATLSLVSTIGVAGTAEAPETVPETLLPRPRFWCPYEESKYWAETVVAGSGLRYRVLRLPIVIGDSRTGASDQKTIYGLLAAICVIREELRERGLPLRLRVRADPDALKNVICVDDVVATMDALRVRGRDALGVFHGTHDRPIRARRILEVCQRLSGVELLADPGFEPRASAGEGAPEFWEAELHRTLSPLRPYMNSSTPRFERGRVAAIEPRPPVPLDEDRLQFLLSRFLERYPSLGGHA